MRKHIRMYFICLLVVALQISSFSNMFITYASGAGSDVTSQTFTLSFKNESIPDLVTVQQDGTITNGTDIEWKITVNKENVAVNHAVLVSSIPSSQVLDISSIRVNGGALSGDIIDNGSSLSISLGNITMQQEVTYTTSLKEAALLDALEAGDTSIQVTNNTILEHDDNKTTNSDEPKTVTIPLNMLTKSGSYDSATTSNNTKNITWTTIVNSDELKFNNAIVKETLPTGLTYVAGTATVNGINVSLVTSGSNLMFSLGNITSEVTISYETEIAPTYFQANGFYNFTNEGGFTWDGLMGTEVVKDASVSVGSNLFTQSGAGYNRANGVISWSMYINSENIKLVAPLITNEIPSTQQYIQGSARIVNHLGQAYSLSNFDYSEETSTLSYKFSSAIDSAYTITYDTKPATTDYITANYSNEFSNTANFTSGAINRSSTGKQHYTSNVLKKEAAGYDPTGGEQKITWKLTVNENGATTPSFVKAGTDPREYDAIVLPNVRIVDDIPDGLTFIPGSVRVLDRNNIPVSGLVTVSGTNTVTFQFNAGIKEQYTIYFDTAITDLSKFISQNDMTNIAINNEATLIHDQTTLSNKDHATQTISNQFIKIIGVPTTYGNKYIDWVVYLNSSAVNLNQLLNIDSFSLMDSLQAGLELDTASVVLTAYNGAINVPNTIPANGDDGLGAGTAVSLNGSHIVYDATSREFKFHLPNGTIDKAYKLSFRTYVTEEVVSGTSFSNSIHLFGSKNNIEVPINLNYHSNDTRQVTFLEAGSTGYGNLGKFIVKKIDAIDNSVKLSGATFALYDHYGNKVQEKQTVDGQLEFNRIKFDRYYYMKEMEAPIGYVRGGDVTIDGTPVDATTIEDVLEDVIPVRLAATHTPKYVELVFTNEEINAALQFILQNEAGHPLAGAQFGLFPRGAAATSTPLVTATSNSLGVVAFENITQGEYDIYEMQAPTGYVPITGIVHTVAVAASDHHTTITLASVSNQRIAANYPGYDPSETAKEEGEEDSLAGAKFGLYNAQGYFVAEAVTDHSGIARFSPVNAGVYIIKQLEAPANYMKTDKEERITLTGNIKVAFMNERSSDAPSSGVTTGNEFAKLAVLVSEDQTEDHTAEQTPTTYSDIAKHWAEKHIIEATELGFVSGYEDHTFKPNNMISRAEFSVMLVKALKLDGSGATSAFVDEAKIGKWAKQAVRQALEAGIIFGYSDNSFRPGASITRAELAIMIARAYSLEATTTSAPAVTSGFADEDDIPSWAKNAVTLVKSLGIVNGKQHNQFAPHDTATRAEAVTMIMNLLKVIE